MEPEWKLRLCAASIHRSNCSCQWLSQGIKRNQCFHCFSESSFRINLNRKRPMGIFPNVSKYIKLNHSKRFSGTLWLRDTCWKWRKKTQLSRVWHQSKTWHYWFDSMGVPQQRTSGRKTLSREKEEKGEMRNHNQFNLPWLPSPPVQSPQVKCPPGEAAPGGRMENGFVGSSKSLWITAENHLGWKTALWLFQKAENPLRSFQLKCGIPLSVRVPCVFYS